MKYWASFGIAFLTAAAVGGCDSAALPECTSTTSGQQAKFVVNTLSLPQSRTDYAYDLNGDAKTENQLGNIIGALSSMSLDPQPSVDEAVADGSIVVLLNAQAVDLATSECASVELSAGAKPATKPKFDGTDTFTVDTLFGGGTFKGAIAASKFASNPPATTKNPTTVAIQVPLVGGSPPIKLVLSGAYLRFTKTGDNIMTGQLNGAIKKSDVDNEVIPNIAQLLSDRVAIDPTSSTNKQILAIFDLGGTDEGCSGGCMNKDGTCGIKGDKKIQVCEIATSSLIKGLLGPDIQMFDGTTYKPNPDNTIKDSLSAGLKFTAVKASF